MRVATRWPAPCAPATRCTARRGGPRRRPCRRTVRASSVGPRRTRRPAPRPGRRAQSAAEPRHRFVDGLFSACHLLRDRGPAWILRRVVVIEPGRAGRADRLPAPRPVTTGALSQGATMDASPRASSTLQRGAPRQRYIVATLATALALRSSTARARARLAGLPLPLAPHCIGEEVDQALPQVTFLHVNRARVPMPQPHCPARPVRIVLTVRLPSPCVAGTSAVPLTRDVGAGGPCRTFQHCDLFSSSSWSRRRTHWSAVRRAARAWR